VFVELKPGQASLHHVLLFHGSEPNRSDDRRIGLAIRYIPTHLKQAVGQRDWATLVRGNDTYGNFIQPEYVPKRDLEPEALAFHKAVSEEQVRVLYRGTDRPPIARDADPTQVFGGSLWRRNQLGAAARA